MENPSHVTINHSNQAVDVLSCLPNGLTIPAGRYPDMPGEQFGEIAVIAKTDKLRDRPDFMAGVGEKPFGLLHPVFHDVLHDGAAGRFAEQPRKIIGT